MEFTVDKGTFADCVAWAARVLPARPASPILSGIKIQAFENNQIEVSSFDYEVSARELISGEVEVPGEVLVTGKLLADISRSLPGDKVHCKLEEGRLQIRSGNSNYSLQEMPLHEYPKLPVVPAAIGTVPADTFKKGIQKVAFAAAHDAGSAPVFTGVKFEFKEGQLKLVATDKVRLAVFDAPWEGEPIETNAPVIVKAKVAQDVARTLVADDGKVEIGLAIDGGLNVISFKTGNRTTTSQLTDGDFPDLSRLFLDSYPIKVAVAKDAFVNALKRVALVSTFSTNEAVLNFREGEVELEAGQGDEANAAEILPCELKGEDITIVVKPSYMLDGLAVVDESFTSLQFTGPSKAIEMGGQNSVDGEAEPNFRYLFVPINTGKR